MNETNIKETGAHYTSPELSNFMANKLYNLLSAENAVVLDPSCGDGELLKAFLHECKNVDSDKGFEVIGIDTDKEAINSATQLEIFKQNNSIFFNHDYLELFEDEEINFFSEVTNRGEFWTSHIEIDGLKKVDAILANPPYVRTQVLGEEKSKKLSKKFNLSGRVDLYQVFLVAMTKHLKEEGLICVITSNRYLTTTGGKDIRKFLNTNYEIIEIVDLGDTKLFDAAVLPAIFIGRKKKRDSIKKNNKVNFYRIYETNKINAADTYDSIFEVLSKNKSGYFEVGKKIYEVTTGKINIPDDPNELWALASEDDIKWSDFVKKNAMCKFHDVFNVRVGIKTTADKVFINKDWNSLGYGVCPEESLLKPLTSSSSIAKWSVPNQHNLKVLYTHESKNGKRCVINLEDFPKAKSYLESHRTQLEGRSYIKKANRNWYEIWVPQDPVKWGLPKVIFPDISPDPKFAIDNEGTIVDGNCYWLSLINCSDDIDLLYLAVAVANSKFMTKFHEIEFQNRLYAGRKRYLTQYVKNYLLPDISSSHSKRIIQLAKVLTSNEFDSSEILCYEQEIEKEVLLAFGFPEHEEIVLY